MGDVTKETALPLSGSSMFVLSWDPLGFLEQGSGVLPPQFTHSLESEEVPRMGKAREPQGHQSGWAGPLRDIWALWSLVVTHSLSSLSIFLLINLRVRVGLKACATTPGLGKAFWPHQLINMAEPVLYDFRGQVKTWLLLCLHYHHPLSW